MSLADMLAVVRSGIRQRRRSYAASTSSGCRATSRSSWTATADGPRAAICRASKGHRAGIDAVRDTVETSARLGISRADAVRVLGRELEAARHRDHRADGPAQALPARRAQDAAQEQHPLPRHRPAGSAAAPTSATSSTPPRRAPATNTGMQFNIALSYGGRAEIVDAARRAIRDGVRPGRARRARRSRRFSTPPASPIPIC